MLKLSFAQNQEDVLLARVFPDDQGFFIDVGACHPVHHSVTKYFSSRGWRGINIEPIPSVFAMIAEDRPHEINLNVGVSNRDGAMTFYEATSSLGLSSFSKELAEEVRMLGIEFVEREVPILTLETIRARYVGNREVDFLKIDVESHERQVVMGADWSRLRPKVVVLEGQDPAIWADLMHDARYLHAAFDGINHFYVREESRDLLTHFDAPANCLDGFAPFEYHDQVERLNAELVAARAEIDALRIRLADHAEVDVLGPRSIMLARGVHGAAKHMPAVAGVVRRVWPASKAS